MLTSTSNSTSFDIFIDINGIDFKGVIDYTYYPEEKMTRDYPGCPASIELEQLHVNVGDTMCDVTFLLSNQTFHNNMESRVWEMIEEEDASDF